MMARLLLMMVMAASAAPAAAQDRCEGLSIARLIEPRSPDYDETTGVDEPVRLSVVRSHDRNNCSFFINIVSEAGGGRDRVLAGPRAELRYELIDANGQVLENTTRGRDRLRGRFRRNETEIELTVRLSIPSGQIVPAGAYADRIAVRLFDQRGGGRLVDEQGVTLRSRVHSRAEINLARQPGLGFDSGRSYDVVDFEELETGERRSIVLRVRANAAYRLTLTSENSGALVRDGGRREDRIGYAAQLDGRAVDLSAPALIVRDPLRRGASEELIFDVTIGEVGEARAGKYADLVTVYVEPVR